MAGPKFCRGSGCPHKSPLIVTGTGWSPVEPRLDVRCPKEPKPQLCSLPDNFPFSSRFFALLPLLVFSSRGGCSLTKAILLP